MKVSQSEVTNGIHVFGSYLPFSPPHPAPGGPGGKQGEDCGVSVQAACPEVMNAEAEAEKK